MQTPFDNGHYLSGHTLLSVGQLCSLSLGADELNVLNDAASWLSRWNPCCDEEVDPIPPGDRMVDVVLRVRILGQELDGGRADSQG
jgi:hypothetical protein